MEHATEKIDCHGQLINVDLMMIPVVNWLNNLPGVKVFAGCQGDGSSMPCFKKPYVAFFCSRLSSIKTIAEAIEAGRVTERDDGSSFRYVYATCKAYCHERLYFLLEFHDQDWLLEFCKEKLEIKGN